MLRDRRNFEVGEDEDENENVIDAERVLDEVAGEKIERAVCAFDLENKKVKPEGKDDPDSGALRGRAHTQRAIASFELKKIDGQRDEDAEMKCDPEPNTGGHRGRRFHVADAAAMPIALPLC